MHLLRLFTTITFLIVFSLQSAAQGKIDQSKEELNKRNKTVKGSQSDQSVHSYKSDEQKSFGEIMFQGVATGLAYLTWYSTIGVYKLEDHLHSNLTKYPYYNNQSGNYESTDSVYNSKLHFRFDLDYHFLYSNKNLIGNYFKCNIRPFQYFYLQGQYHRLTEHNTDHTYSNLSLFNAYFCYDRLRFERFNVGWKAGLCYIADNINRGGFSFGLDGEAFLIKPVSVYISKQWGAINTKPVNQFEVTGKLHLKRYNIHLGYEHLKIASPVYDYVLAGAGVRL
ncbi:hypothetical protein A3860_11675 [Niastella vici]|uniref:Outer membrane protein beta-barrel domain-containing protein n=1 Tax=Niastella vici TaxID=1703345 RepID=A0A1V9FFS0_9BACT|nr:hypothetical protein [Niastella vici]OQP57212.1 hypothetical protein A3860_11675 [Niastella vici]